MKSANVFVEQFTADQSSNFETSHATKRSIIGGLSNLSIICHLTMSGIVNHWCDTSCKCYLHESLHSSLLSAGSGFGFFHDNFRLRRLKTFSMTRLIGMHVMIAGKSYMITSSKPMSVCCYNFSPQGLCRLPMIARTR